MVWMLFVPLGAALSIGAYASYHEGFKRGPYFVPAFLVLQLLTGLVWIVGARNLGPRQLFTFGLVWDGVAVAAFCLVPMLFFGVTLKPWGWIGLALIVLGSLIVKGTE